MTAAADSALLECRQTIAHHSKSFALASKVLPPRCRDQAAIIYTWCRHADDAVDETPRTLQTAACERLRLELDGVYGEETLGDPVLAAFQSVVRQARIPQQYPTELLAGMAMDASDTRYQTTSELLVYCYRVASTVGLMMSHVMGVDRDEALTNAAHLGIAMQLTNICRDVLEDWQRGRLYLPEDVLARHGGAGLVTHLGGPLPLAARAPLAAAVAEILALAERYYRSGDRGLRSLPARCAFGVRAARLVYSAIGQRIRAANCDVLAGRQVVPTWKKLLLVGRAALGALAEVPRRLARRLAGARRFKTPTRAIEAPHDVICL